MRFATSLCRGADRSRPRASTWMRHRVALRNSNQPGFGLSFGVKQTGGRELVARLVQRNQPIGIGIGLAGRLSG
jgi:hypothetical protein